MSLSHRERVQAALEHKIPDRCPMQICFTPEFASGLILHLKRENATFHYPQEGGYGFELERFLGQDILLTSPTWDNSYFPKFKPYEEYTDDWGIGWKAIPYNTKFGTGIYTEIVSHPLADENAVTGYKIPDPNQPDLYHKTEQVLRVFKDEYFIAGVAVTTIFEKAWALRGYEQIMMDMLSDPELVDRLFELPFNYHLSMAKRMVELGVDMIWIGDDVGTQNAMLISPEQWRRFFKEKMAHFIRELKSLNNQLKVAYHSDGYIYPIIPELIEIGLDILNPIQPGSMNPGRLKKEFGNNLCFWGSIDEQNTLPFGTPEAVRKEVFERVDTLGRNGGLIIGPTHHVQLDTPMENFFAMVNAMKEAY